MMSTEWTAQDFRESGVVLFIDKPLNWTSYQVVRKVRSLFNVRKVGHAGTLDPKATGLLIVCTGKRTREIESFMGMEKEYEGAFELGIRTPSYDLETEVVERRDAGHVTIEAVRAAAQEFTGPLRQRPPMYSAVKQDGKPLYAYARRGEERERKERDIRVERFEIIEAQFPAVTFRLSCSKGTYVRSLVDDIGQRLGCGATLTALRRTRIGIHQVADAWTMDALAEISRALGIVKQQRHAHRTSA